MVARITVILARSGAGEDAAPIHSGGNLLESKMPTGNVQQTIDAATTRYRGTIRLPLLNIVIWKRDIAGMDGG